MLPSDLELDFFLRSAAVAGTGSETMQELSAVAARPASAQLLRILRSFSTRLFQNVDAAAPEERRVLPLQNVHQLKEMWVSHLRGESTEDADVEVPTEHQSHGHVEEGEREGAQQHAESSSEDSDDESSDAPGYADRPPSPVDDRSPHGAEAPSSPRSPGKRKTQALQASGPSSSRASTKSKKATRTPFPAVTDELSVDEHTSGSDDDDDSDCTTSSLGVSACVGTSRWKKALQLLVVPRVVDNERDRIPLPASRSTIQSVHPGTSHYVVKCTLALLAAVRSRSRYDQWLLRMTTGVAAVVAVDANKARDRESMTVSRTGRTIRHLPGKSRPQVDGPTTVRQLAKDMGRSEAALANLFRLGRFVLEVPEFAFLIVEGYLDPPVWSKTSSVFTQKTVRDRSAFPALKGKWHDLVRQLPRGLAVPTRHELHDYLIRKVQGRFEVDLSL
jgi:hypothetical protein